MCRLAKISTIFIDDKLSAYRKPNVYLTVVVILRTHYSRGVCAAAKLNCSIHKYPMINKFHFAMVFNICLIVVHRTHEPNGITTRKNSRKSVISTSVPVFHTVIQFSTFNEFE